VQGSDSLRMHGVSRLEPLLVAFETRRSARRDSTTKCENEKRGVKIGYVRVNKLGSNDLALVAKRA
jgi:hypothetical protein